MLPAYGRPRMAAARRLRAPAVAARALVALRTSSSSLPAMRVMVVIFLRGDGGGYEVAVEMGGPGDAAAGQVTAASVVSWLSGAYGATGVAWRARTVMRLPVSLKARRSLPV